MLTRHGFSAAAAIIIPGICKFSRGHGQVELEEAELLGVTHFQPSRNSRIRTTDPINTDKFSQEYFSVFSNHHNNLTGQVS